MFTCTKKNELGWLKAKDARLSTNGIANNWHTSSSMKKSKTQNIILHN